MKTKEFLEKYNMLEGIKSGDTYFSPKENKYDESKFYLVNREGVKESSWDDGIHIVLYFYFEEGRISVENHQWGRRDTVEFDVWDVEVDIEGREVSFGIFIFDLI